MKKRLLASFLALVMVITLLPISALATGGDAALVAKNNPVANTDNGVTVNKYVSQDENGQYKLTLEAYASDQLTTTTTTTPLDIVLVLDVSGSMDYGFNGGVTYVSTGEKDWSYNSIKFDRTPYYYKTAEDEYKLVKAVSDQDWHNNHVETTYSLQYAENQYGSRKTPIPESTTSNDRDATLWTGELYTLQEVNRMDALQTAVDSFIDSVAQNARANGVDHQISLVKFAGQKSNKIGDDKYWDSQYWDDYNCSQIVKGLTSAASGAEELKDAVDALEPGGATRSDFGMAHAKTVLDGVDEDRTSKKVVVLFTDGQPTKAEDFNADVANDAINTAKVLKESGVTVYTVGIFDNANPNGYSAENKYMNGVSSNYPNATAYNALGQRAAGDYYFAADSANSLQQVFSDIAHDATTSHLTSNPDAAAVLSDTLSQYFNFPAGLNGSDEEKIEVKFVKATGYNEETGFAFEAGGTVLTGENRPQVDVDVDDDGNNIITIEGFDYKTNAASYNETTEDVGGGKLVVTFPIVIDENACNEDTTVTDGYYPTNKTDSEKEDKSDLAGLFYKGSATSTSNDANTTLTESPAVYYTKPSFTVTWMNGTTTLETDTGVTYGTQPSYGGSEPTKAQDDDYTYNFIGWSADPDSTTGVEDTALPKVTKNETYYAIFSKTDRLYTLSYDTNGGNPNGPAAVELGKQTDYTLDSTTKPTHADAADGTKIVFIGWTAEKDPKIYSKNDTAPDTITQVDINGDTTVYAVWGYDTNTKYNPDPDVTETKYKVTYEWTGLPNENLAKLPDPITNLIAGDKYTVDSSYTSTNPVKDTDGNEYTFSGWKLNDAIVTGEQTIGTANVTLTGTWEKTGVPPTTFEPEVAAYKVEHYWVKDGVATLHETEFPLYEEIDETATAVPKTYPNYVYDANYSETVASGTVIEPTMGGDGQPVVLTLKLYYTYVPSAPEIDDLPDILGTGAVTVDCVNPDVDHAPQTYGVLEGGCTVGAVAGDRTSGYTCTISVSADPYVTKYNEGHAGHVLATDETTPKTIQLTWNDDENKWEVTTDLPIHFNVVCTTYTLTYDANEGTINGADSFSVSGIEANSSYALGQETGYADPIKGDDVFIGWTTDASTAGKVYSAGDELPVVTSTVDVTLIKTVYAVWGYDTNGDEVADAQQIMIEPAPITIYTGGNGYTGVVEDAAGDIVANSTASGMPEPGYYFTLPYTLDQYLKGKFGTSEDGAVKLSEHIRLTDKTDPSRQWILDLYDGTEDSTANGKYIYRLSETATNGAPAKIQISDGTTIVTSDDFVISTEGGLYKDYQMSLYTGAANHGDIVVEVQIDGEWTQLENVEGAGTVRGLGLAQNKLTVRGEDSRTPTWATPVGNDESAVTSNTNVANVESKTTITAVAPAGTTYDINDSDIAATGAIALFTDGILSSTALESYLESEDLLTEDSKADYQYLDLVDTSNGNAYVTASNEVYIYWKLPADADPDGTFHVVHFNGLDRNYNLNQIDSAFIREQGVDVYAVGDTTHPLEVVTIDGQQYVKFSTASFSPFALVYEKEQSGGGSTTTTTYYTLRYESNGGTTYSNERYPRNRVVTLDKVPLREGYSFTGWYADEELTEPITTIKMDGNKTVYAGWRKTNVPDGLNGEDHFAYVIGYVDGTVKPLANITRSEVAAIFFRLLDPEVREEYLTDENPFTDVNPDDWYSKAVSTLYALGIFKGRTETTFVPDAYITRAEFAAICARFDTGLDVGGATFNDIEGHWAEDEISRAASLGWIMGSPDGNFYPDQLITRAEAMCMINRVLNRIPEDESDLLEGMNVWPDNPTGTWYYLVVQEATNTHDYTAKGEIYETWTELLDDPDWLQYQ